MKNDECQWIPESMCNQQSFSLKSCSAYLTRSGKNFISDTKSTSEIAALDFFSPSTGNLCDSEEATLRTPIL